MSEGDPTGMRSPLGRALGLGSAGGGARHWWGQRLSSIALVPLGAWFALALLCLPNLRYEVVHAWAGRPVNAVLLLLLIAVGSQHSYTGVEVIVEDYVPHQGRKLTALLLLRFAHVLAAAAAMLAVVRVALGGGP
jgi:succinate dehydrogenase / fumarate reductase, membrane anchor subunit